MQLLKAILTCCKYLNLCCKFICYGVSFTIFTIRIIISIEIRYFHLKYLELHVASIPSQCSLICMSVIFSWMTLSTFSMKLQTGVIQCAKDCFSIVRIQSLTWTKTWLGRAANLRYEILPWVYGIFLTINVKPWANAAK